MVDEAGDVGPDGDGADGVVHGVEDGPAGVLVRRGGEHAALFVWEELGAADVAVVDAVGEDGGFGGEALEVLLERGLVVHGHGTGGRRGGLGLALANYELIQGLDHLCGFPPLTRVQDAVDESIERG